MMTQHELICASEGAWDAVDALEADANSPADLLINARKVRDYLDGRLTALYGIPTGQPSPPAPTATMVATKSQATISGWQRDEWTDEAFYIPPPPVDDSTGFENHADNSYPDQTLVNPPIKADVDGDDSTGFEG